MKLLFIGTLFPNRFDPTRGVFNLQHLRAIASIGSTVRVVAPMLTVPGDRWLRGRRLPPQTDVVGGLDVHYPRVLYTPGLFQAWHHRQYARGMASPLRTWLDDWKPDAVLVSFAYPDGAAMAPMLAAAGVPWGLLVLGSDFRVRGRDVRYRDIVRSTLLAAPRVFCTGDQLGEDLVADGIPADRVRPFANGVDFDRFHPPRTANASDGRLLFVGTLRQVKGPDRLMSAWLALDAAERERLGGLDFIGDGPMRRELAARADAAGVEVGWLGRRPHEEIAEHMRAARALVLPSRSEGMPNVVLEALASGTPVVATAVGEVPGVMTARIQGTVVPNDEAHVVEGLATALRGLGEPRPRADVAATVAQFSWESAAQVVVDGLSELRTANESGGQGSLPGAD